MLDDLAVTDSDAYAEMAKEGAKAMVSVSRFEVPFTCIYYHSSKLVFAPAALGGRVSGETCFSWSDNDLVRRALSSQTSPR